MKHLLQLRILTSKISMDIAEEVGNSLGSDVKIKTTYIDNLAWPAYVRDVIDVVRGVARP
jgi:hypothetical protein